MKETVSFWKREFVLPWHSKANVLRSGVRRLPRTLSSMQIILLCGFASIILLRNTIGAGSFGWSVSLTPEIDAGSHSLVSFNAPRRNNVKINTKDLVDDEDADELDHPLKKSEKKKPKPQIAKTLTAAEEDILVKKILKANGVTETIVEKDEVEEEKKIDEKAKEVKEAAREVPKEEVKENASSKTERVEQNAKSDSTQQRKLESSSKSDLEELYMPWMPPGKELKSLGPKVSNWDEQREKWLMKHPEMRLNKVGKPRMLLVTGSSPWPCANPVGDHYYLKSIKNKIDYCRQHNIEIFYNIAHLDKEMSSYWAKLPILRKLMLTHPEVEWFFWMDADAMFTDMLFEIPMEKYVDYNLVMWGYDEGIYTEKSWVAINNGVFFIRNCQWTLDLLDMWAPMGPEGTVRVEAGKMLTSYLTKRPEMPADDQSALAYLIVSKEELRPKVKLEWDYWLSGYWADIVEHYEEYMTKHHPGLGDNRWPFTTHFTGCQPCSGVHNPNYSADACVKQMERAFNFADNQVVQMLGFQHESLESVHLKRIREDTDQPLDSVSQNTWVTASESYGL
ncbi:xyloglucan 6-xylosyltransferase [Marchantia polymorpha subsp. ruderalis]|uniref:Uncharacterized protein n=2 Tax=Marchantia polymorpha TaxID=3197 RepID=A0A176VFQ9_MARPO|nr:hypothetical protein AXG93_2958s1090 [Marchantia polymorpha subsp. ruderalis]PTQ44100.1 hypothetical protein MARPO_0022s0183 [Marchantia polymorpha]BBN04305.1 hypothetical protein Mp_3g03490 [Marchantia polymorpha subsp. ruderalis]|eukprot:PTQ44100.1 hypothetical protein MARPO_0022s0183 [Marchantia polymorpha]